MSGCKHGHPIEERYRSKRGFLCCRGCDEDRNRRDRARRDLITGMGQDGPPRTSWIPRAQCRETDPSEFDVDCSISGSTPPATRIDAMWDQGRVCEGCPVLALCARDALAHDDMGVVRAGVPIAAWADLSWRRMERAALAALATSEDVPADRRTWRKAAHRTADRRRAERKAKQAAA